MQLALLPYYHLPLEPPPPEEPPPNPPEELPPPEELLWLPELPKDEEPKELPPPPDLYFRKGGIIFVMISVKPQKMHILDSSIFPKDT